MDNKLKGLKRVLVKRVLPHGFQSEGLEYDKKYKYFYRPLVKFHITKQKNNINNYDYLNPAQDTVALNYNEDFRDKTRASKKNKRSKIVDVNDLIQLFSGIDKHVLEDQYIDLNYNLNTKKGEQSKQLKEITGLLKLLRNSASELYERNPASVQLSATHHKKSKIDINEVTDLIKLLKTVNMLKEDKQNVNEADRNSKNRNLKDLLKLLRANDRKVKKNDKFRNLAHALLNTVYGVKSGDKKAFWSKIESRIENLQDRAEFYKKLVKVFSRALRAPIPLKSEEVNEDDVQKSIFALDNKKPTEKPKLSVPHYPYWNYWTYQKNLFINSCRQGWVRYQNMCIEVPPQRK